MQNKIKANELFEIYGPLLTPRQQEICEMYYQEDFSLFEIAEELEISRSAVQDAIKKSTNLLEKFESVVQYIEKRNKVFDCLEQGQIERITEIL